MDFSFFSPEIIIATIVLSMSLCFIVNHFIQKNKQKVKGENLVVTGEGNMSIKDVKGENQVVAGDGNVSIKDVKGNVIIAPMSAQSVDSDSHNDVDLNTYILFIDDEPDSEDDMNRIKSLKSFGYTNVHLIKDGTVTSPEVVSARFVFVDITGVGKAAGCSEGTELAVQIKKKYGDKKIVSIYSSTETHKIFKGLESLDGIFGKNDDSQVYLDFIEQYAK